LNLLAKIDFFAHSVTFGDIISKMMKYTFSALQWLSVAMLAKSP